MIEAVISAGASIINITDTVGYATPDEFAGLVGYVRRYVRNIHKTVISVHCHNDLGLAVANSLAAVQAGATQVECTVGGIGERAGNCALEEFVMSSRVRRDVYPFATQVNAKHIFAASQALSKVTGQPIPWNKPIVGKNIFSHASGVHQDGVIKNRRTYEIMRAEDVGRTGADIVLTSRSGSAALFHRIKTLRIPFDPARRNHIFGQFKQIADMRTFVSDDDIRRKLTFL
jgi:2-isopropylmalate synthase